MALYEFAYGDGTVRVDLGGAEVISVLRGHDTPPLADIPGFVKKINLHKRYAEVEISFLGQKTIVHLGIDILAKEQNGNV